ncbi:DUF1156 domain-containing protein [Buchananella hordeovulneris]|uniref:DUF1156 domain-containing protein n=1 Tax=Buchananella hordeovulneris TaxID=52770 RepID=A0A1Q5PW25_9ACTO|nr:DUF1156 domain-containing protein [Buchananella hordeovulneris]OKL51625.1 hypothetical protein BSZ40_07200 [Buchananella hordeovulneris]
MSKKLIETSLPLEAINAASVREKSIRHGHPSTLHLYWSRKPLATARAVLFAQLVDDPSARPEEFPTEEAQAAERARLHDLLSRLVQWENSNDEALLAAARAEIAKSNGGQLPAVLDPFAGGGSIPLEAQRLGLAAHASDLNPLAVLLNKALIELPPRFAGAAPIHPGPAEQTHYVRAEGLAEDVRHYGRWLRDAAARRIGHLYPPAVAPDGTKHTVIAWKWARTVRSPNPAHPLEVPLVNSWWLSKKKGKEAWVHAEVVDGQVRYEVRHDPAGPEVDGTIGRTGGHAVGDGTPLPLEYVRAEARAGRMGAHLLAVVADGPKGRLYCSPTADHVASAVVTDLPALPAAQLPERALGFRVQQYGMTMWTDLFTNRQLVALTTFSDLVGEARAQVAADAEAAGLSPERARAYADAVATYLALAVSRQTDRLSSLASWDSTRDSQRNVFARQALPMVWDFAEANPFSNSSGNFLGQVEWVAKALASVPAAASGTVAQLSANEREYAGLVVSTDPPYYDNIGYSDLSDYFYVWLRRMLREVHPAVTGTLLTPKAEELVANPYRHGSKEAAAQFFVDGFNGVFARLRAAASPTVPLTVYYAYKQQDGQDQTATGWHTLLAGLIDAGWRVTATWPVRSELANRPRSQGSNALASSIVLACRPRPADAPATDRRKFVAQLKRELPAALRPLMQGAISPVDLAQAAIGPGIAVFSRYAQVREADGTAMSVRAALALINHTLDEVLHEQEADFDPDTRFAVKWYRQHSWGQAAAGEADQLARSADTSLAALERGGIFVARGGQARLLPPAELAGDWDPHTDAHLSIWEATVRLAARLGHTGLAATAALLARLAGRVDWEAVKELGFLLFHEAEKQGHGPDAGLFNALVTDWAELTEQARALAARPAATQTTFDLP